MEENFNKRLNISENISTSNLSVETNNIDKNQLVSSLKNSSSRSRSPNRMLSFSTPENSPPPTYANSIVNNHNDIISSAKPHRSVSIAATGVKGGEPKNIHSTKYTRKIFNNWRSACGRTKDRTKDLIRRWKTLPENSIDFDSSISGSTEDFQKNPESPSSSRVKFLMKKSSESDSIGKQETTTNTNTGPSSWSVHVWTTWVQRGLGDNEDDELFEEPAPERDFLSGFQKDKLTYFFRYVLDMNHDDVISAEDFVTLNQRIRHYIEWSSECIEFHVLKEVHSGFLECFLNQPLDDSSTMYYCKSDKRTRHHVNIDEWLDVWGNLLHGAQSLRDLPLWLQYFPKILFQVINKSGSGHISREELRAFYIMFLGIDFKTVNETLDTIFYVLTDNGKYKINYAQYKLCFTNFLLSRNPNGPGQYLFGICSPNTLSCSFPIDYSALNTDPNDLEPYDPEKDKNSQANRRSVIV